MPNVKPMIGLEPITCWLQISCSANWATSAYWIILFISFKWDLQGSNLWPSACKADALPAELRSHIKRPRRDSNPWPPPWQGGALTNWATRPSKGYTFKTSHKWLLHTFRKTCFSKNTSRFSSLLTWLSPRPISNSQLHTLLCFHLCPIYLVVFKGSYSRRRDISSWGGLHA